MKILLIGATGYTGSLLFKLLCRHPHVNKISALSSKKAGLAITDDFILLHKEKLISDKYISIDEIENHYDVIFSALPHGVSAPMYQLLMEKLGYRNIPSSQNTNLSDEHPLNQQSSNKKDKPVYIDLSADFRFNDFSEYLKVYTDTDIAQSTFLTKASHKAVYGLSEIQRHKIPNAEIIACPGCYPTSVLHV